MGKTINGGGSEAKSGWDAHVASQRGVGEGTFRYRVSKGWPVYLALTEPPRKQCNTYSARAIAAGLKPYTVYWRMHKRGMSIEEALSKPLLSNAPRSLAPDSVRARKHRAECRQMASTLLGRRVSDKQATAFMKDLRLAGVMPRKQKAGSLKAALRAAGCPISYSIFVLRIRKNGWSVQRAIQTPLTPKGYRYDGSPCKPSTRLGLKAREAGLDPELVRKRVVQLGWSEKRALSTPLARDRDSLSAKARAANLSAGIVQWRIREGWSEARALSTPATSFSRCGLPLGELRSKAREAGLNPSTVSYRLKHGWSEERALSTPSLR